MDDVKWAFSDELVRFQFFSFLLDQAPSLASLPEEVPGASDDLLPSSPPSASVGQRPRFPTCLFMVVELELGLL